jgi:hypothetical protein
MRPQGRTSGNDQVPNRRNDVVSPTDAVAQSWCCRCRTAREDLKDVTVRVVAADPARRSAHEGSLPVSPTVSPEGSGGSRTSMSKRSGGEVEKDAPPSCRMCTASL